MWFHHQSEGINYNCSLRGNEKIHQFFCLFLWYIRAKWRKRWGSEKLCGKFMFTFEFNFPSISHLTVSHVCSMREHEAFENDLNIQQLVFSGKCDTRTPCMWNGMALEHEREREREWAIEPLKLFVCWSETRLILGYASMLSNIKALPA